MSGLRGWIAFTCNALTTAMHAVTKAATARSRSLRISPNAMGARFLIYGPIQWVL
jgi:hypothetical protein